MSEETLQNLVQHLSQNSARLSSSLKMGKLIVAVIGKYGKQVNRKEI